MRQPSKIRNIARWTGTILCIVLGLAWIFSLIMTVLWRRPTSPTPVPSATVPGHLLYPGRFCQLMYGVVQTGNSYSPTNAGGWDLFRGSAMPGWVLRRYNWGFVPPRFIPGGVLIPLWLPLLVVGVPVAWSWYTALWRYPPGIRVLKRRWVPRDWSKRRCVLLSIPVFVLAFVFVPYGLEWLSEMAFGSGQVQHLSQRLSVSENAVLGILILIWLVITYAIGRLAYMGLRWRRAVVQAVVDSGAPACPACFYNMSGNTTGVCPECGAVVPALRMDAESQAAN